MIANGLHYHTPLLTRQQASEHLAISLRTLDQLSLSGAIPRVTIGRSVRFRMQDLEDFVATQTGNLTNSAIPQESSGQSATIYSGVSTVIKNSHATISPKSL